VSLGNDNFKACFKYVDHFSDVGIISSGKTVEDLFSISAEAMFGVMAEISDIGTSKSFDVTVASDDLESLMVDWLSELLFIFDSEETLLSKFDVQSIEKKDDEYILNSIVFGDPTDNKIQRFKTEVKAVTYNKLRVEKKDNFWEAEVVLDL